MTEEAMTRAELVAAALERWEYARKQWPEKVIVDGGDALAVLLRESQPEPALDYLGNAIGEEPSDSQPAPVVGDDEALHGALPEVARAEAHPDVPPLSADALYDIGRGVGCDHLGRYAVAEIKDLRTRLRAALADVARLEEEQAKEAREWNDLRDRYDATVLELTQARAALAAAVAEGDQFCRTLVDLYDAADETGQPWRRISVSNALIDGLRARAGRNDAG